MMDFIAEQIEQARFPSDQFAAVDAARGVIPFMKSRLAEDEVLLTTFMLVFGELMFVGHWEETWTRIAKESADQFVKSADDIIGAIDALRAVLQKP